MSILKCYASYHNILGRKLLLSTFILSTLSGTTYAAGCTENAPGTGNYTCTGVVGTTQYLNTSSPLTVVTEPGFSINVGNAAAFQLRGTGGLSFNDSHSSTITGSLDGILTSNNASGILSITTTGMVTAASNGIDATNYGTDMIIQAVDVTGGGKGIVAGNRGTGALSITSTGSVNGGAYQGISAGNNGTDLTIQAANATGKTIGISAINNGTGKLSITTTGMVTGISGYYGIYAINQGTGPVSLAVDSGSVVQGDVAGIYVDATTPADITNAGIIRNLSDLSSDMAIRTTGTNTSSAINNHGLIQGTVQLSDAGNRFINHTGGTWNTAGGSNEFGADVETNNLVNDGTIIAANGSAADLMQTTIFDNVGTFSNAGTLTMANNRAGDVTIINGNYEGKGGTLWFDTVLGDDSSASDKLVVNGNTSGITRVGVNNLGGRGAATLEGIELIQVSGISAGEFVNAGRIVAGAFDYTVMRGVGDNTNNWYLSSRLSPVEPIDPDEPTDPVYPIDPDDPESPLYPVNPNDPFDPKDPMVERPEPGAYTANLAAANSMFVTHLHDRLGETKYIDVLTGEQKVTSLWLRNEGGHNRFRDDHDQLRTQANRYVLQLGGDIAQWAHGQDRFHLGLMVGYGNTKSNTVARSGYDAKGSVTGYSVGAYGTWSTNQADKAGLYVDGWLQYSWFNNSVNGQDLASESYKSKGMTASVESGYRFKLGENSTKTINSFIQPQAQLTWMGVKADDHTEVNATRVTGEGDGNLQSRLGVKAFMDVHHSAGQAFQPFVEANWLHNSKDFGTNMNGISVKQEGSANIAELKLGVEGQVNKQVNLWGNVAQQVGNKGYSDTAVTLGAKYSF